MAYQRNTLQPSGDADESMATTRWVDTYFLKLTGGVLTGLLETRASQKTETASNPFFRLATTVGASGANSAIMGIATSANAFINGSTSGDTVISAKSGGRLLLGTSTAAATQEIAIQIATDQIVTFSAEARVTSDPLVDNDLTRKSWVDSEIVNNRRFTFMMS